MTDSEFQPNRSSLSSGRSTGLFVGRLQEMALLRAALNDVMSGQGRLVMLVGEPGIGKTRTAQELADEAATGGAQVLWGKCYEEAGAPPYWPWVESIRSWLERTPPDQVQAAMGPGGAYIAEIIPEVRHKIPQLEPTPSQGPEAGLFRLFDSIAGFLKYASRIQPLALVLDDLHWADTQSLRLLHFVAGQMADSNLMIIGCYRDIELSRQHPLSETLAQLSRESVYQRQVLRGLSSESTTSFIEAVGDIRVSPGFAEEVYSHTEGNPFFTTEVIRLLSELGELSEDVVVGPQGIRIPEGVREVIGQRLNRLSAECNSVLTTASVIGREFNLALLDRLDEQPTAGPQQRAEDGLLERLEEALKARLIEELPPIVGRYQFTHRLIQETLLQELSLTRRVRMHARVAQALEQLYYEDLGSHAPVLAYHYAQAETITGTDKLVHYSLIAGRQALAAFAFEEASSHFQRGLTAKGVPLSTPDPAPDEEAAALLAGLGAARIGTHERGYVAESVVTLSRAFAFYAGSGDVEKAVKIGLDNQFPPNAGGDIINKALKLVSPDSHEAGVLLSRNIMLLRWDHERASNAFHRAMAITERYNNLEAQLDSLSGMACVDMSYYRFADSLERNRRAIGLASSVDQPAPESHAWYDLMHVLFSIGDLEGATSSATSMLKSAQRSGIRRWQASAMECNENVCCAKGEWKAARSFSDQGLAISPRDLNLLGGRVVLEYQVGDFQAGEAYLQRFIEAGTPSRSGTSDVDTIATMEIIQGASYTYPMVVIPIVARIAGVKAWFDVAETIAENILSWQGATPIQQRTSRIGLALMAVQRDDSIAVSDVYAVLSDLAGSMSPTPPHGPGISGDRVLGLLAQALGKLDQAVSHFEEALAFCRNGGYLPELAWTCYDYADALGQRDGPVDRTKTIELLDEALAITTELSMRPLMERTIALRERLTSQSQAIPAYPDGLTQREVEVLRLIAQGKSNTQISQELVVAEGTARRHVANIYEKIGVANRAEATRYALRDSLLSLEETPGDAPDNTPAPGSGL